MGRQQQAQQALAQRQQQAQQAWEHWQAWEQQPQQDEARRQLRKTKHWGLREPDGRYQTDAVGVTERLWQWQHRPWKCAWQIHRWTVGALALMRASWIPARWAWVLLQAPDDHREAWLLALVQRRLQKQGTLAQKEPAWELRPVATQADHPNRRSAAQQRVPASGQARQQLAWAWSSERPKASLAA